jgi:hypothetical protein
LRQAVKLLNGEKIEKKIILDTATITKENADQLLKENGLLQSTCHRVPDGAITTMPLATRPCKAPLSRPSLFFCVAGRSPDRRASAIKVTCDRRANETTFCALCALAGKRRIDTLCGRNLP